MVLLDRDREVANEVRQTVAKLNGLLKEAATLGLLVDLELTEVSWPNYAASASSVQTLPSRMSQSRRKPVWTWNG